MNSKQPIVLALALVLAPLLKLGTLPVYAGTQIGADLLYMQVDRSNLFYAINGDPSGDLSGPTQSVRPESETGFRVNASHDLSSRWIASLSYTALDGKTDDRSTGTDIWSLRCDPWETCDNDTGYAGVARANYKFDYSHIAIEFGYDIPLANNTLSLQPVLGLARLDVEQELHTVYDETVAPGTGIDIDRIDEATQAEGIGLLIGLNSRLELSNRFELNARWRFTSYSVDSDSAYSMSDVDASSVSTNTTLQASSAVSASEIGVGINWLISERFDASLAYQVINISDGLGGFINFPDDTVAKISIDDSGLGFNGVNVNFRAEF
ncbi:MAG: autotransporter domain-containing protein [Gammaproteobacteria bacterium]|nr:autotransporter domain-containing protein [Gammaproteobacteria bacterium]